MSERYILMVCSRYYPDMWNDFAGTFKTIDEAKSYAEIYEHERIFCPHYKWAQIIDKESMKVVTECQSFADDYGRPLPELYWDTDPFLHWWTKC